MPNHIVKDTGHILSQTVNGTPHFQGNWLCLEWICAIYIIYKDIGHILNESVPPKVFKDTGHVSHRSVNPHIFKDTGQILKGQYHSIFQGY